MAQNYTWFRFHIDKWRNGTFGLKPNEVVVYIAVLCELYENEGFCKIDDEVIFARRLSLRPTSFRTALDSLVSKGKLDVQNGFITNSAVSEEIISRAKLAHKSAISRAKVEQNSAKNPMISIRNVGSLPHNNIQNHNIDSKYLSNSKVRSILTPPKVRL